MPNLFTSGELARRYDLDPQSFRRFVYEKLGQYGFIKGGRRFFLESELVAIEIELRRAGLITTRPGAPTLTA